MLLFVVLESAGRREGKKEWGENERMESAWEWMMGVSKATTNNREEQHTKIELERRSFAFGMDDEGDGGDEGDEGDEGGDDRSGVYGTWEYMSPECWKREYGEPCFASDVFSFGVILWEMWTSQREYASNNHPLR